MCYVELEKTAENKMITIKLGFSKWKFSVDSESAISLGLISRYGTFFSDISKDAIWRPSESKGSTAFLKKICGSRMTANIKNGES